VAGDEWPGAAARGQRRRWFSRAYETRCALVVGRSAQTDLETSLNGVLREFEIGA
jgi:hypothetical protein